MTNKEALLEILSLMEDPMDTVTNFDKITKYLGAFNQIAYGVHAPAIPAEEEPTDQPPQKSLTDEDIERWHKSWEKGQTQSEAFRLAN